MISDTKVTYKDRKTNQTEQFFIKNSEILFKL